MTCKTCSLLSTLDEGDAEYLNSALLAGLITAVDAHRILVNHAGPVGITTVRVHRSAQHSDFPNPG